MLFPYCVLFVLINVNKARIVEKCSVYRYGTLTVVKEYDFCNCYTHHYLYNPISIIKYDSPSL